MISQAKKYILDSYEEAKKVTWPTKNQTINYSLLVIALSVGMAVFFSLLDFGFSTGLSQLINR
jgi:preprotein translocase subunit SecE